jgi:hypothetical protein
VQTAGVGGVEGVKDAHMQQGVLWEEPWFLSIWGQEEPSPAWGDLAVPPLWGLQCC